MAKLTLQTLGRRLSEKQGDRGVRKTAAEIGISPATLSRVERGYMPDLETFGKICRWLRVDPAAILGIDVAAPRPSASVHFKKNQAIHPDTARALAELILAASRASIIEAEDTNDSSV